jgi:hypothetical protein
LFNKTEKPIDWGVLKLDEILFIEPYTFSKMLLNKTIKLINSIAELTPIEKLFPEGIEVPDLQKIPPKDDIFSKEVGQRLDYLY